MSGEKSWEEMIERKRSIERGAEDKGLEVTRERGQWHAEAQAKREEDKTNAKSAAGRRFFFFT